jgi:hypothetical protein
MKRLWVILFVLLFIGCAPKINTYLEPHIKELNQEVIYNQGIPVVVSRMPSSIMAAYLLKTPDDEFRVFIAANNLSQERILFSYQDVKSIYNTSGGDFFAKPVSPKQVLINKIQTDRFEMALLAVNGALQSTRTTGTLGGESVDITTTTAGLDAGDLYTIDRTKQQQIASTTSLQNSLLLKNTVFPNSIVSGFVFLEDLLSRKNNAQSVMRRQIRNANGYLPELYNINIRISFGNEHHQFWYSIPKD